MGNSPDGGFPKSEALAATGAARVRQAMSATAAARSAVTELAEENHALVKAMLAICRILEIIPTNV